MGLHFARRGREAARLYKEEALLAGDSFRMYLQDTAAIQSQHVDTLHKASQEVMDLIFALPTDVIALSNSMTDGTNDPDMHE